jgi:hypothetical protein
MVLIDYMVGPGEHSNFRVLRSLENSFFTLVCAAAHAVNGLPVSVPSGQSVASNENHDGACLYQPQFAVAIVFRPPTELATQYIDTTNRLAVRIIIFSIFDTA